MPGSADAQEPAAGPWCTECGAPATYLGPSMDPGRPIGRCRRGCSKVQGLSRVIATYSAAERLDAQRRHHRRMSTRQHHRHVRGENVSPYCTQCNRLGWSYAPA